MKANPNSVLDILSNQRQITAQLARTSAQIQRQIASEYATALKGVRAELSRIFEKYAINNELTYAELNKYGRLQGLEKELNQIMGHGHQVARAKTEAGMRLTFDESVARHQWGIQQQISRPIRFGRIPKNQVQAAIENPLEKIAFDRLRNGSRVKIQSALAQNLINGTGYRQLARDVASAINGTAYDALRIARTEMHRVQNEGHIKVTEQAQALGLEIRKVWISVDDDRTRGNTDREQAKGIDHLQMHLEVADKDGIFTMPDGYQGEAPGKIGIAHHDIQCRCQYIDQVVEE